MRDESRRLQAVLARSGEGGYARMVETALSGAEDAMEAFLVSNELWGGPGSIADQAAYGQEPEDLRQVERALTALGEVQIRVGKVNPRTEMRVAHFKQREQGKG